MQFQWQSPPRYPQDLRDIFFELFRKVGISIDFMLNQSGRTRWKKSIPGVRGRRA